VATVGAVVIAGCILALVESDHRAGPYDVPMRPAVVQASLSGTYDARGDTSVMGLCLDPPCDPHATLELRIAGLPDSPYEARLEGPAPEHLGPLRRVGDAYVLAWSRAEDHTDKEGVSVLLAGRVLATVPFSPGERPVPLDGPLALSWGAAPDSVHLNEIGGFVVSTVVKTELETAPPDGWVFVAWLEGWDGITLLGPLEAEAGRSVLDARVERLPLERQTAVVVAVAPAADAPAFPVLRAAL